MKITTRLLAVFLAMMLLCGALPLNVFAEEASGTNYIELSDGYLSVKVSTENGGFLIDTVEGNQLKKSDDNKFLLYPDSDFDTSYTSFRVKRGDETKDYIFGRDYGFLGLSSSSVEVEKVNNSISAKWTVDGLTFIQTVTLLDTTANQHGMAFITYEVENAGEDALIEARIMMDTALGYQDYALYELTQGNGEYVTVESEQILEGNAYVSSFYAWDNEYNPTVTAYTVNATVNDKICQPTRVAFGHWNNLASTVFDFTPGDTYFTNPQNEYLTADSAYALYFDMGEAKSGEKGTAIGTYYGIYSNAGVDAEEKVAINVEMPASLQLNEDADGYVSLQSGDRQGTFTMNVKVTNVTGETLENIAIALYPEDGLVSYSLDGVQNSTATAADPFYVRVVDLIPGEERQISVDFAAVTKTDTEYRKIGIRVFDIDGTNLNLLEEKVIGERDAFVLCPGGSGTALSFSTMTPDAVYYTGSRSLYLAGANFTYLRDKGTYDVILRSIDGRPDVKIPSERVFIDTEKNTAEIVIHEQLDTGTWQVVFDWKDATKLDTTSEALRFLSSNSKNFKNTVYGIVTIELNPYYDEETDSANKYSLYAYESEEDYELEFSAGDKMDSVLMEFRGDFSVTLAADNKTVIGVKGTAIDGGDSINISNCLDVDNGTLEISVENAGTSAQEILVDIDGEVYTTGARSKVWSGVCALTAITNNTILAKYNQIGKHLNDKVETSEANKDYIMLCWPGAASGAQTLAGMIMEFRYAEFGRMFYESEKNEGASKFVIAFGAEVSPDFLVPSTFAYDKGVEAKWDYYQEQNRLAGRPYVAKQIRDVNERNREDIQKMQANKNGSLSIALHDILFGGGFIGFNASVEIGIPAYTQGMPSLEGSLNLKVMGEEWAMNVKGAADFIIFEMEGELGLRSYKGVPVPDKLYFFMGGVTPGINVDGMGIFWIRGLGGGVDKIYDTIFTASVLPPLTIMLKGQFALFGTLTATGELSLSARGFSAAVSDIGVAGVNLIDNMYAELYWYPTIRFAAGIEVNILDIIYGSGSLILQELEEGFFWEGFVTAGIKIPAWIPAIGGTNIGSTDLGVNQERIWGAVHVLGIDAGVTYYWGGDVEFGLGKYDAPEPTVTTFRMLRSAVATDESTGRTLYMAMAASVDGLSETVITPNETETLHTFTLDGALAGKEDALICVSFPAVSLDEAKNGFTVTCGGASYPLTFADNSKELDAPANAGANARIVYDEETGTATVSFTVTDAAYFNSEFAVTTVYLADVSVYGMPRLPDLESISVSGSTATLAGDLDSLDGVVIYATAGGESYVLYDGEAKASVDLTFPKNMPSGTYTLSAVGSTADMTSNPIASLEGFTYTNPDTPAAPTLGDIALGGDYTLDLSLTAPAGELDGYLVTVYEVDGEGNMIPTIYKDLLVDKAQTNLTLGGQYTTTIEGYTEEGAASPMLEDETVTYGLVAGKTYVVGVRSCKDVEEDLYLASEERFTEEILMAEAVKPEVSVTAVDKVTLGGTDYVGTADVTLSLTSDETLKNLKYMLDDGGDLNSSEDDWTEFNGTSISLTDLSEGGHKIVIRGEDAQGDGFELLYTFTVRATAPKLMLSSPENGSFFEDKITVSGITDPGVDVTVTVNGTATTVTADADGNFVAELDADTSTAYADITVKAKNFLGNESRTISLQLMNSLVGEDGLYAVILCDGEVVTQLSQTHNGKQLTFGLMAGGKLITVDPSSYMANRAVWEIENLAGNAMISYDGVLSGITADSHGMVRVSMDSLDAGAIIGGQKALSFQNIYFESGAVSKYEGDESFTLAVQGAAEGSVINYYSSDESVATVDANGTVTIVGRGTANITAVADAIGEYQQTSTYYVLTVNEIIKQEQTVTTDLSDRQAVCGEVLDAREVSASGTVTFSSSNPAIAEVDPATGEITVHRAGEVTITLRAAETKYYLAAEASYKLTVSHSFTDYKCACGEVNLDGARAELEAAIRNGDLQLEAKITALNSALNAAKAALEEADAENKAELEAAIASAEATLQAAIDALAKNLEDVKAELEQAITELEEAIEAGKQDTTAELEALNKALEDAKTALEAADAESKAELEEKIASAEATLQEAIDALAKNLEDVKAELEQAIAELEEAIEAGKQDTTAELEALNKALEDAKTALEAADAESKAELEEKIGEANAALQSALEEMASDLDSLRSELESKDSQLQSFMIIVCIISGIAFVGCGSFVIWFFIDRRKRI